jgi:tRNA (guanine6-N2)-methyltransferase
MTKMNYYLSVFPGLAGLAAEELRDRLDIKAGAVKRLRNAELLTMVCDDSRQLLELRLAEDVFAQLGVLRLTGRPVDLKTLAKAAALGGELSRMLPARSRFRVVVQADDAPWRQYRRVDVQTAAEGAVLRGHPGWRLVRDEAPVEVWLQQVGHELMMGLRLTTGAHRARGGRTVEREAALRPTIAAAMVRLTQPADDDVFLDPMCGSGTILLERAAAGRYALLLGGDNDTAAVEATLANFGPRHQPKRIEHWDARALPLEDASVDKLACNLPWGRQVGRPEELPVLYRDVLRELVRVVKPGGRAVLLTSEWELLKRVISAQRGLKLVQTVSNIEVLGRRADMVVLIRQ